MTRPSDAFMGVEIQELYLAMQRGDFPLPPDSFVSDKHRDAYVQAMRDYLSDVEHTYRETDWR